MKVWSTSPASTPGKTIHRNIALCFIQPPFGVGSRYAGVVVPTRQRRGATGSVLFDEGKLADLADVDILLHDRFAIFEFALEVELAGARAVIDINHHRLTRHDDIVARNVFFPVIGGGARRVEGEDGGLGLVDDLDLAVSGECGVGAGQCGDGDGGQQEKTLEHDEPYENVEERQRCALLPNVYRRGRTSDRIHANCTILK